MADIEGAKELQDVRGNDLLIFNGQWTVQWALDKNENLILTEFSQDIEG